jgi:hypothetical protein
MIYSLFYIFLSNIKSVFYHTNKAKSGVNLIFWGEIELSEQFPKSKQEEFNISYAS